MAESKTTETAGTAEAQRSEEGARTGAVAAMGAPISANANGAPSARTTAAMGTPGIISLHDSGPLAPYIIRGARTGSLGSSADDRQRLCFAVALWNGKDPILKERIYGLTSGKPITAKTPREYYFTLMQFTLHSYMKYLYKYPHAEYPYVDLSKYKQTPPVVIDPEYELLSDTGEDPTRTGTRRAFVEYAKRRL